MKKESKLQGEYYIETVDKRNIEFLRLLKQRGHNAHDLKDFKHAGKNTAFCFSPARKFTVEEVKNFPSGIAVFCGKILPEVQQVFNQNQIKHKNFMEDEIFVIYNSALTVEGILALIIENTDFSMSELNFLILGYGKLGTATAQVLRDLKLNFAVANYGTERYFSAHQMSNKCYLGESFKKDLQEFDVIINTIPAEIFNNSDLKTIKTGALVLETASKNCLNADAEEAKHFNYVMAPALPMRFTYKSAAKAMADSFGRQI